MTLAGALTEEKKGSVNREFEAAEQQQQNPHSLTEAKIKLVRAGKTDI